MPTNFKTYETQARLLAAVVAAHPELKLNYKGEFMIDSKFPSSGCPIGPFPRDFGPVSDEPVLPSWDRRGEQQADSRQLLLCITVLM